MIKISDEEILQLAAQHPTKVIQRPRLEPCIDLPNEQWKIISYAPDYLISNMGRVKTERLYLSGKWESGLMRFYIVGGLYKVKLTLPNGEKIRPYIHRLVLDHFSAPSENKYCLFKDGNKLNPKADNVSYTDRTTLYKHYDENGTMARKNEWKTYIKRNGQIGKKKSIFSPKTLEQIRFLNSKGISQTYLAERFKTSQANISKIINQ